jgi:Bacterial archaeo-eukaryotic release factor family 3
MPLSAAPIALLTNDEIVLREPTLDELRSLQREAGYPLVSVLVSTAPDLFVGNDHLVRIDALFAEAQKRLRLEFDDLDVDHRIEELRELATSLLDQRTSHGIALFGSDRICTAYRVASRIDDRVVIDPTFATRDLARSIAMNPYYRLLVLTQDSARLLVGSGERLTEVTNDAFPIKLESTTAERGKEKGPGDRAKKELHDASAFVRQVSETLRSHTESAHLPLIAMVSTAMTGALKAQRDLDPIGVLVGNHERAASARLATLVRPTIDAYLAQSRESAMERLDYAVSARQAAVGINHVWTAAQRETIDTLLVDESFRFPAWTTLGGKKLVRAFTPESPDVIDDAVDEVIEMVQRVDATVCFVPAGDLGPDKIAAVLTRRASLAAR